MSSIVWFLLIASIFGVHTFSDIRLNSEKILCSLLHGKCEWRQDWKHADGIRRELDVGKPSTQFYYFCKNNYTVEDNCGHWIDENGAIIESASKSDKLVGEFFVIEKLGIHMIGDYYKIPVSKGDTQLLIE